MGAGMHPLVLRMCFHSPFYFRPRKMPRLPLRAGLWQDSSCTGPCQGRGRFVIATFPAVEHGWSGTVSKPKWPTRCSRQVEGMVNYLNILRYAWHNPPGHALARSDATVGEVLTHTITGAQRVGQVPPSHGAIIRHRVDRGTSQPYCTPRRAGNSPYDRERSPSRIGASVTGRPDGQDRDLARGNCDGSERPSCCRDGATHKSLLILIPTEGGRHLTALLPTPPIDRVRLDPNGVARPGEPHDHARTADRRNLER